jgi:hypothetical protein
LVGRQVVDAVSRKWRKWCGRAVVGLSDVKAQIGDSRLMRCVSRREKGLRREWEGA